MNFNTVSSKEYYDFIERKTAYQRFKELLVLDAWGLLLISGHCSDFTSVRIFYKFNEDDILSIFTFSNFCSVELQC